MQGWIKLHRKLLENPVVCKDSDRLAVWIYLLLNATHDCYPVIFKGKKISLQPGQLLTGRKSISKTLVIGESKVQRILSWYESEHQIEQLRGNTNRLISIVKWDEYQSSEQLNEQRMNNCRTTDEQLMNTNKNVKNDNKDLYGDFFEQIWKLYPIKKGKAGVSKTQIQKLYKIGIEELSRAIKRYDSEVKDKTFMKHGDTFFNKGYVDYLDLNYQTETKSTIKTVVVPDWAKEEQ